MMSFHPEEPTADDQAAASNPEGNTSDPTKAATWEVPHQSHAPTPVDTPPGTFFVQKDNVPREQLARPVQHLDIATSVAVVIANLPWIAASFIIVVMVLWLCTTLLSVDFLLVPLTWIWVLSGLVVLLPSAEPFVAQYALGLRRPTHSEAVDLDAAWHTVAHQAGISPTEYTIWIDDRASMNSCQPGGRFLSLSRAATTLPSRQQAALVAHELSHQLSGHTWIRMLVQWYSAPARSLSRLYGVVLRATRQAGSVGGPAGATLGCLAALVWLILGLALVGGLLTTPLLRPAIVVLPFLPWLSRWAEKRCDRVAADLGFGSDLMDLFRYWQESGRDDGSARGVVGRLFASRPTIGSRMHALQTYLTQKGLS
jgi:Zn-dependent protease with chaperone function